MRSRLVAAFLMVTILSVGAAGLVRTLAISSQLDEQQLTHLHQEARVALTQVERLLAGPGPDRRKVTSELLGDLATDGTRLEYVASDGRRVEATGGDYPPTSASADSVSAQVFGEEGSVVATQSRQPLEAVYRRDLPAVLALLMALTLLTGLAGFLAARRLTMPFRRLAVAADTLGRGRVDLDLPRSRVVEAETIATALRGAASRLDVHRRQEHVLAERASHMLRTPLTRMTLTLDEMAGRDDLPEGVLEAVDACRDQAAVIGAEVQGLVEITRTGLPTADVALPLRVVAEEMVTRWAERLPARRRLSGAVGGDVEMPCAPGPLEQALDLLLPTVAAGGRGPVRLEFTGRDEHVLVVLSAGALGEGDPDSSDGVVAARQLVTALGGRVAHRGAGAPLEIRLPSR